MLWSGAPRQGLVFQTGDLLMVPFTFMWGGFAFFWELTAIRSHAPIFMRLWGVPFVAVGLYIMVGRFIADAWRRAHTAYGVTTDRVIIAIAGPAASFQSIALSSMGDLTIDQRPDGSGTISFGSTAVWGPWMSSATAFSRSTRIPQFAMIADAQAVYDKIREAQRALPTASPTQA